MGGVLSTPTSKCRLCKVQKQDCVTLKCNHCFCQECLGDLWSVEPDGPFRCPEWKCSTSYKTMPIDSIKLWPPNNGSRPLSTPGRRGTSTKDPRTTFVSPLEKRSLVSQLLGKRKASIPTPEHPDTKRPLISEQSAVKKTLLNSPCNTAEDLPSGEASGNGLTFECDTPSSSSDDGVSQVSLQHLSPSEMVETDNSDGSTESVSFDVPLLAAPQQGGQVSSDPAVHCQSFTASTTSILSLSPVQNVSKSSVMLPKHAAVASGSPFRFGISDQPEKKNTGPVLCHYCPQTMLKELAVKTCLVCGASMCVEHLRPHKESPVFQSHTLVPPTEDVSVWRCQEHQEINRIYCRQCAVCLCTVCTVIGSHRGHVCISIREAEQELRGNLKGEVKQLQRVEEQVKNQVNDFTQKEEAFRVILNEAQAGVRQQYAAIREAFQLEEQLALNCLEQEEYRVVGSLQDKLSQLNNSLRSIQEGLYSLEMLVDAKGENLIRDQAFIMEYRKVPQLNIETIHELEAPEEANEAWLKCLKRWTEKRLDMVVLSELSEDRELYVVFYGSVFTLDANTAHPKLLLSDNNRRVMYTEAQQAFTEQDARFSSFPQVLAKSSFQGGRKYWEVDVSVDKGCWMVGLCEARMERKGQRDSSCLGFNALSWCLSCDRRKLVALHNKTATPVTADRLQRLGVLLDYEGGVLTFFNVTPEGSLVSMHLYKHKFTEPLYPAFSVSKTHLAICDLFEP